MTEPVALADLKTHLRLDPSATDEDSYLNSMITAARRACEKVLNRAINTASQTLTIDAFPARPSIGPWVSPIEVPKPWDLYIELPGGTVTGIDSIDYIDDTGVTQTIDDDDFVYDIANVPARIAPIATWPKAAKRPGAVTITYNLSDMAADDMKIVSMAMMLMIAGWYRNRESTAVDVRGIPTEIPIGVTFLLNPLKQWATE